MRMTNTTDSRFSPFDIDAAVKRVIALIDELIAVIEEENRILARGIPASLSTSVARKNELAGEFEQWVKHIAAQQLCAHVSDAALRQRLLVATNTLRVAMTENVERLRAAIDASRRRIEAVMRAVRTEISAAAPYGPNARIRDASAAHSVRGAGIRA